MQNEIDNFTRDESLGILGRRRFLGWFTVAACGIMFNVRKAKAGAVYSTKPVKGIPQSWVNQKGLEVLRYANYIKSLRLKHVTPYHVLKPHFNKRGRTRNSIPPRYMWKNIAPTLRVIDRMAALMGARVKPFTSVYRSPTYNRAVRGRSKSLHLSNKAVDVQFYNVSARTVARAAGRVRSAGHFRGGIGRYRSFTHVDTRGQNVNWG